MFEFHLEAGDKLIIIIQYGQSILYIKQYTFYTEMSHCNR